MSLRRASSQRSVACTVARRHAVTRTVVARRVPPWRAACRRGAHRNAPQRNATQRNATQRNATQRIVSKLVNSSTSFRETCFAGVDFCIDFEGIRTEPTLEGHSASFIPLRPGLLLIRQGVGRRKGRLLFGYLQNRCENEGCDYGLAPSRGPAPRRSRRLRPAARLQIRTSPQAGTQANRARRRMPRRAPRTARGLSARTSSRPGQRATRPPEYAPSKRKPTYPSATSRIIITRNPAITPAVPQFE